MLIKAKLPGTSVAVTGIAVNNYKHRAGLIIAFKIAKRLCSHLHRRADRRPRLCVKSADDAPRKFVPIILSSSNLRTATASVHLSPATAPADTHTTEHTDTPSAHTNCNDMPHHYAPLINCDLSTSKSPIGPASRKYNGRRSTTTLRTR